MTKYAVKVINGPVSTEELKSCPDPDFTTKEKHLEVMAELMKREPLFHQEEYGTTREDYERMTEADFWEVGASGRRYSREYVVESLEGRYENLTHETWYIEDFQCQEIAKDNYLVTYTLFQDDRQSRRSTIWRRSENDWKIVYHQGTLVEQTRYLLTAVDVSIRVAEERDAEAACRVLRRSITECCTKDHRDDQEILDAWLANKTPANVRSWFSDPSSYAVVAVAAGDITGVAKMEHSGEVTLCYLVPEARYTGVGKALLAKLEAKGKGLGLRELRLFSTKTAYAFYLRNGFEASGMPDSSFAIEGFPMVKALGAPSSRGGAGA